MNHRQKSINVGRYGDKLEVIVRDNFFTKIYQKEVNVNNKNELEGLLRDLKNKGVDLIGLIKRKMISGDDGWFD